MPRASEIEGVAHAVPVTPDPEVQRALPLLVRHLNRANIEPGVRFPIISLDENSMEKLKEHFQDHPSAFGEGLLERLEEGNAAEVERYLRNNHILMVAHQTTGVRGVFEITTLYQVNPAPLEAVFGELASRPEELLVYGINTNSTFMGDIRLKGTGNRLSGFFHSGPNNHTPIAVVDTFNKDLATTLVNEAAHLEQFKRWGPRIMQRSLQVTLFGESSIRSNDELQSDAVSAVLMTPQFLARFVDTIRFSNSDYINTFKELSQSYPQTMAIADTTLGDYLQLGMPLSQAIREGAIAFRDPRILALHKDHRFKDALQKALVEAGRDSVRADDIRYLSDLPR